MKPVVTAVLVSVCVLVLLGLSLGFAIHLGYISFEDGPSSVSVSQGSGEHNHQHQASVVVPFAASLPLPAKVAISITIIILLVGLAVGAYVLWQNYQDDIIRVVDPESHNLKLEKEQQDLERDRLQAHNEEQEKQAAADRLWKAKLIFVGVSAVFIFIPAVVLWYSKDLGKIARDLALIFIILAFLVMPVVAGVVFQSWSLFFVILLGLLFFSWVALTFYRLYTVDLSGWGTSHFVVSGFSVFWLVLLLIALFV